MPRLKNMKIRAVALVDEGANRRKFFLLKSKSKGGIMTKETAIKIVKSKVLDKEGLDDLLGAVDERDRDEVMALAENYDSVTISKDQKELDAIVEKIGVSLSKVTQEQLQKLEECITVLKSVIDELAKELKEGKYPYPYPYQYKKPEVKNEKDADKEITAEDFDKMLQAELDKLTN